jgi:dynactin complex subunit
MDNLQINKMYLINKKNKVIKIKKKTKCFITFDLYTSTYNNNIYNLKLEYNNMRCKMHNENDEILIKLDSGIYYDELILKNCCEIFKYEFI